MSDIQENVFTFVNYIHHCNTLASAMQVPICTNSMEFVTKIQDKCHILPDLGLYYQN